MAGTELETKNSSKKATEETVAASRQRRWRAGSKLEARTEEDGDKWFPARVQEVDKDNRRVLIHYVQWNSRHDEWVASNSSRLRPLRSARIENNSNGVTSPQAVIPSPLSEIGQSPPVGPKDFKTGERIMANWKSNRKFPATITGFDSETGQYKIEFYDGVHSKVKPSQMRRMTKEEEENSKLSFGENSLETSEQSPKLVKPLDTPKEESPVKPATPKGRRERKRKFDVKTLLNLRPGSAASSVPSSPASPATPASTTKTTEDDMLKRRRRSSKRTEEQTLKRNLTPDKPSPTIKKTSETETPTNDKPKRRVKSTNRLCEIDDSANTSTEKEAVVKKSIEKDISINKSTEKDSVSKKSIEKDISTNKSIEKDISTSKSTEKDSVTKKSIDKDISTDTKKTEKDKPTTTNKTEKVKPTDDIKTPKSDLVDNTTEKNEDKSTNDKLPNDNRSSDDKPAVEKVTNNVSSRLVLESMSPSDALISGKRERKKKKFWDEEDGPSPRESKAKTPQKIVASVPVRSRRRNSINDLHQVKAVTSTPKVNHNHTIESNSSIIESKENGKTLKYMMFDLDSDPKLIAEKMVEGVNIPGPGEPIPIDSSKLPKGWEKRVIQRGIGITKGEWDVFVQNSAGKSFRSKNDLQKHIDDLKLPHTVDEFDFSLDDRLKRLRQIWKQYIVKADPNYHSKPVIKKALCKKTEIAPIKLEEIPLTPEIESKARRKSDLSITEPTSLNSDLPAIGVESETGQGLRCSIEKCGKLFRSNRLLQQHVKHYHPEVFDQVIASVTPIPSTVTSPTLSPPSSSQFSLSTPFLNHHDTSSPQVLSSSQFIASLSRKRNVLSECESMETEFSSGFKKRKSSLMIDVEDVNFSQKKRFRPMDDFKKKPGRPSGKRNLSEGCPSSPSINNNSMLEMSPLDMAHGRTRTDSILSMGSIAHSDDGDHVMNRTNPKNLPPTPPTFRLSKRRQAQLGNSDRKLLRHRSYGTSSREDSFCRDDSNLVSPELLTPVSGFYPCGPLAAGSSSYPPSEMDTSIASEHLTSEEVVHCACKRREEDGLMIQCDICLCWQHGLCLGIEDEDQVPEKHICMSCKNPRAARSSAKFSLDQDWLKEGKLPSSRSQIDEEDAFKKLSELMADLSNLSKVLHSLRVKLQVASQTNNGKVFMWSSIWDLPPSVSSLKEIPSTKSSLTVETLNNFDVGDQKNGILDSQAVIEKLKYRLGHSGFPNDEFIDHVGRTNSMVCNGLVPPNQLGHPTNTSNRDISADEEQHVWFQNSSSGFCKETCSYPPATNQGVQQNCLRGQESNPTFTGLGNANGTNVPSSSNSLDQINSQAFDAATQQPSQSVDAAAQLLSQGVSEANQQLSQDVNEANQQLSQDVDAANQQLSQGVDEANQQVSQDTDVQDAASKQQPNSVESDTTSTTKNDLSPGLSKSNSEEKVLNNSDLAFTDIKETAVIKDRQTNGSVDDDQTVDHFESNKKYNCSENSFMSLHLSGSNDKENGHLSNDIDQGEDIEHQHNLDSNHLEETGDQAFDPNLIPTFSEVARLLPSVLEAMGSEADQEHENDISSMPQPQTRNVIFEPKRLDKDECRLNLLDHIASVQNEVEVRLEVIETALNKIEEGSAPEPLTKAKLTVLLRDIATSKNLVWSL